MTSRILPVEKSTAAGAAAYSRFSLLFYDFVVMGLENHFVFNIPTSLTLDHYNKHVTNNHLEIGVGTGYFLDKCTFPSDKPSITLLDINRDCLNMTAQRLRRYQPQHIQQNILGQVHLDGARFDSVGLNYVLHCLPGSMLDKAVVFENIRPLLKEGGCVFGTTVLGRNANHKLREKLLIRLYNRTHILNNWEDDVAGLETILSRCFREYSVQIRGRCIAFFVAR